MNQTNTYHRKNTWQRTFEITANPSQARTLNHFIKNELAYYQLLSSQLGIRMRAFPEDFISNTPSMEKLWLFAARYSVSASQLKQQPQHRWPSEISGNWQAMWNKNGDYLLTPGDEVIMNILATPCHMHRDIRRNMAEEVIMQVSSQADILHAAQNTQEMRAPVQTLPEHDYHTKRHVQIPRNLVKCIFNAVEGQTELTIPYCHDPLLIQQQDITDSKWDLMVISQLHNDPVKNNLLQVSLRTTKQKYIVTYQDGHKPTRIHRM